MATLSIARSPDNGLLALKMASGRVPLRDAPSAVLNSPMGRNASTSAAQHQLLQHSQAVKLVRSTADSRPGRDTVHASKIARVDGNNKTTVNVQVNAREESLSGLHKRSAAGPTMLQKRLEAARAANGSHHQTQTRQHAVPATNAKLAGQMLHEQNLENVRIWQKHYRKVFPQMVFYFDGLPKDQGHRLSGHIRVLGATEAMFFSRDVTHVVTTRAVPNDNASTSSSYVQGKSPRQEQGGNGRTRTINPQLLDSRADTRFTFEANANKKFSTSADVLHKAKELGIKIWTVDKIQRVLSALIEDHDEGRQAKPTTSRSRTTRGAELSQLLQNERRQQTGDRDWMSELVGFKGCFLYVHDMDERTKPVMIRDYQRPTKPSDGKWPQLRSNSHGKSPFIIEDMQPRRHTAPVPKPNEEQDKPRTRASTATVGAGGLEQSQARKASVLGENPNPPMHRPEHETRREKMGKPDPPKRGGSTDQLPMFGSAQASIRKMPRFVQGEPVASGVQHSNVTSAVRSQVMSSTAVGAPGAKTGSTREMNALMRRVLENKAIRDAQNAVTADAARPAKRKLLRDIVEEEDGDAMDEDEPLNRQRVQRESQARKKRVVERDSKPGYCENCHDKYDDFDEHIESKIHRKFALDSKNFKELDNLLCRLTRI